MILRTLLVCENNSDELGVRSQLHTWKYYVSYSLRSSRVRLRGLNSHGVHAPELYRTYDSIASEQPVMTFSACKKAASMTARPELCVITNHDDIVICSMRR